MDAVAYQTVSTVLFSVSTLTFARSLVMVHTFQNQNMQQMSAMISFIGAVHYSLMTTHVARSHRIFLRYSDWLLTVPILRIQYCTLDEQVRSKDLYSMFLSSIGMLVTALPCHFLPNHPGTAVLVMTSLLCAQESIRPIRIHRVMFIVVYGWYTILFLLDLFYAHMIIDIAFAVSDMMVKTLTPVLLTFR